VDAPPPPTTPELLAVLRGWLAVNAPGLVPSHFAVHFHYAPAPLQLPIPPVVAVPAPAPPAPDEGRGPGLSAATCDILRALREAGRPPRWLCPPLLGLYRAAAECYEASLRQSDQLETSPDHGAGLPTRSRAKARHAGAVRTGTAAQGER
jgi:hypothetical protein